GVVTGDLGARPLRRPRRGAAVAPAGPGRAEDDMTPRMKLVGGLVLGVAVIAAGTALPYVEHDTYTMTLALQAVLLSMLALSIGFLARHLGLISLGHTAFFGGAAYAVGVGINRYHWGPTTALLFGVAIGTLLSMVMGILVVRAS